MELHEKYVHSPVELVFSFEVLLVIFLLGSGEESGSPYVWSSYLQSPPNWIHS